MAEGPTPPPSHWKLALGEADTPAAFLCVESVGSERHAVVSVHGALDTRAALPIASQLVELLAHPLRSMTLDLHAVTFVDSAGLGVLNIARNRATSRRIELRLRSLPDPVRNVLEVAGMVALFTIDGDSAGPR